MESFKRIVTLLNLSVSDSETNLDDEDVLSQPLVTDSDLSLGPASGDVSTMQANCVKDFIIFQNLTEFWQLFLPEIRPQLFGRWNFVIGEVIIELSAKNPLVSGFYKMFSTCLQVCQTIALFEERDGPDNVVKVNKFWDVRHVLFFCARSTLYVNSSFMASI